MKVYSYYYGASQARGIDVQAATPGIEKLSAYGAMRELASFTALSAQEREGEMLMYLLTKGDSLVLGLSYTEQPKSSGYNRNSPCGLIYACLENEYRDAGSDPGRLMSFASFKKPDSAQPAPLSAFPINDSGYLYHHAPGGLTALVQGMLQVALPSEDKVLLVAISPGKSTQYAAARYAAAEALSLLPKTLRRKISLFTGLPVSDGQSDALNGFDNALRLGANVIFCSPEQYQRLRGQRSFLVLDMDNAQCTQPVGEFARLVAGRFDGAEMLSECVSNVKGKLSLDSLNEAAANLLNGQVQPLEKIVSRLKEECAQLKKGNADLKKQCAALKEECDDLKEECAEKNWTIKELESDRTPLKAKARHIQDRQDRRHPEREKDESKTTKYLLLGLVVMLLVLSVFITNIITKNVYKTAARADRSASEMQTPEATVLLGVTAMEPDPLVPSQDELTAAPDLNEAETEAKAGTEAGTEATAQPDGGVQVDPTPEMVNVEETAIPDGGVGISEIGGVKVGIFVEPGLYDSLRIDGEFAINKIKPEIAVKDLAQYFVNAKSVQPDMEFAIFLMPDEKTAGVEEALLIQAEYIVIRYGPGSDGESMRYKLPNGYEQSRITGHILKKAISIAKGENDTE